MVAAITAGALAGCDAGQGAPDGGAAMDVVDVVDAPDAPAVDDGPAMDVVDVVDPIDAPDVVDAPDVIDVIDVPDVTDAPDVVDVVAAPDLGTLMGNARCESATALVDGAALEDEDLSIAGVRAEGCFPFTSSPSLFYRATVRPNEVLTVTILPRADGPVFNPVLRLQPGCGSDRCITQSVGTRDRASTTWTNYSDLPQTVTLSVSSAEPAAAGRFRVETVLGRLARNASCDVARALSIGTALRAQAFGDADIVLPVCAGATMPAAGATLYYRVTVPGRQALHVTATPSSNAPPVLRLLARCDDTACLADSGRTATGFLHWLNPDAAAREVFVVASAWPATRGAVPSPFDLLATTETPPAQVTCAGAVEVGPGAASPVANTAAAITVPTLCADNVVSGAALWYRVRVPAGRIVVARALHDAGALDPVLRLYDGCGGACLAPAVRDSGDQPAGVRWFNQGGAEAVTALAVASASGAAMSHHVEVTLRTPPAHATCAGATAVSDGASLVGQSLDDAVEVPPACTGLSLSTPALWYRVTVPAGRTLAVSARRPVSGGAAWTPTLRVLAGCESTARCYAASAAGSDANTSSALWRNAGTADEEVRVALGASTATGSGPVDLRFDLAPEPAQTTCEAAVPIGPIEQRTNQLISSGGAVRAACALTAAGGALYYQVVVPPGATLVAAAQRTGGTGWNPLMDLATACDAGACLASSAAEAGGAVLRWRNPGDAPQTARLGLYASARVTPSAASLSIAIAPPRYSVERVPASCETVGPGWVSIILGPSAASSVMPLPFAFRSFGDAVARWSMSTNGFMQLWPAGGGSPSATGSNVALPSTAAPPGLVAPFWDLFSLDNATSRFFYRDVPGADRHLTVSWGSLQLVGVPLSLQVKLYADTDVMEFHYCQVNPSPSGVTTGGMATIGLQDAAGLRGLLYAFNMPDAIAQGVALRFTPLP